MSPGSVGLVVIAVISSWTDVGSGTVIPTVSDAHMFWWLYYAEPQLGNSDRPLYMWLQGGPGSSGTGFGNFQEMGPIDDLGQPRNTTWLQKGDLLFVDNPVGTGFSYVTNDAAYAVNVTQISKDLLTFVKHFFNENPIYQKRPFYILSESYGGKMTAHFGAYLYPFVQSGKVPCNFKGVGLGDSWVSPMDFVNSWGNYLYYFSYLSDPDLAQYSQLANKCQQMVDNNQWWNATECWDNAEVLVGQLADDVSWYNVLKRSGSDPLSAASAIVKSSKHSFMDRLRFIHSPDQFSDRLSALMNGPVRRKLGIIPASVQWGGQGGEVFNRNGGDFMKPVISSVDYLLSQTNLKVVIYNGQLDLICDTVPADAPYASLRMLQTVFQ